MAEPMDLIRLTLGDLFNLHVEYTAQPPAARAKFEARGYTFVAPLPPDLEILEREPKGIIIGRASGRPPTTKPARGGQGGGPSL